MRFAALHEAWPSSGNPWKLVHAVKLCFKQVLQVSSANLWFLALSCYSTQSLEGRRGTGVRVLSECSLPGRDQSRVPALCSVNRRNVAMEPLPLPHACLLSHSVASPYSLHLNTCWVPALHLPSHPAAHSCLLPHSLTDPPSLLPTPSPLHTPCLHGVGVWAPC